MGLFPHQKLWCGNLIWHGKIRGSIRLRPLNILGISFFASASEDLPTGRPAFGGQAGKSLDNSLRPFDGSTLRQTQGKPTLKKRRRIRERTPPHHPCLSSSASGGQVRRINRQASMPHRSGFSKEIFKWGGEYNSGLKTLYSC